MSEIREPSVSGSFYPSNPDVLRADIEGYLAKVPAQDLAGDIRGLVSPHAGYMYSGQTAAYGYKALSGRHYDTVIILAPSHQSFFVGAAVQEAGGYRTPLGVVEIDEALARELREERGYRPRGPEDAPEGARDRGADPLSSVRPRGLQDSAPDHGQRPGPAILSGAGRPHL